MIAERREHPIPGDSPWFDRLPRFAMTRPFANSNELGFARYRVGVFQALDTCVPIVGKRGQDGMAISKIGESHAGKRDC